VTGTGDDVHEAEPPTPAPDARWRRGLGALMVITFALLPLQEVRPHPRVTISDLTLVAAAVVALAVRPRQRMQAWLTRPLAIGLALMLAGGLIGLVAAGERSLSAGLLVRLVVVAVLSLWVVARWDPRPEEARRSIAAYVAVAAYSAAMGTLAALTRWAALEGLQNGVGRAVGFGENANLFGSISAVALAAGAVLAVTSPSRRGRWGWVAAAAALGAGIAWSGSRSALLAVVVGVAPVAIHQLRHRLEVDRRRTTILGLGVLGVVLVGLLLSVTFIRVPVIDRFLLRGGTDTSSRSAESTEVRADQITEGLEERGPWSLLVGSGLQDHNPTALHNAHLEAWVGLGLLGIAGWATVIAVTCRPATTLLRRRSLEPGDAPRLAASSGFLAYATCALFVDNFWNRYVWLFIALVAVLGGRRRAPSAPTRADTTT